MSVETAIDDGVLAEVLVSIRQTIHAEQKRTELEREVFEEFATRIADLQPSNTPSAGSTEHGESQDASNTVPLQSAPISGPRVMGDLAIIRGAYEETVMGLPFYETEYGDTYEVSIRKEFGPDVATALTEATTLSPIAKRALLRKSRELSRNGTCYSKRGTANANQLLR